MLSKMVLKKLLKNKKVRRILYLEYTLNLNHKKKNLYLSLKILRSSPDNNKELGTFLSQIRVFNHELNAFSTDENGLKGRV